MSRERPAWYGGPVGSDIAPLLATEEMLVSGRLR
jgi:hypothetical protein